MKYRAITSENFYFIEMKKACKYLLKNKNIEDMRKAFKEEDILDVRSLSNFQKKYLTINRRLGYLTEELKRYLVESDSSTGRAINLYTILCSERIVLEFADEVLKEKYMLYDYIISQTEFTKFLRRKEEQSEVIKNWSEGSKKKVIVKLKNFLLEGGLLTKVKEGEYKINRPIILPEIREEIIKAGKKGVLAAMLY